MKVFTRNRSRAFRASASGAILLDGLVAILLFSIGILGVVALQAVAIRFTSNAKYRTDAAMYSDQIVAQMWGGVGDRTTLNSFATGGQSFQAWATQVASGLPGASDYPPTVTLNGTEVTVTVSWKLPSEKTVHSYTTISQVEETSSQ